MKKTPRQKIDEAIQRAISDRESVELRFSLREGIPKEIYDGHPSTIRKIREMGVVHGQHLFVVEPRDNKHNARVVISDK